MSGFFEFLLRLPQSNSGELNKSWRAEADLVPCNARRRVRNAESYQGLAARCEFDGSHQTKPSLNFYAVLL